MFLDALIGLKIRSLSQKQLLWEGDEMGESFVLYFESCYVKSVPGIEICLQFQQQLFPESQIQMLCYFTVDRAHFSNILIIDLLKILRKEWQMS